MDKVSLNSYEDLVDSLVFDLRSNDKNITLLIGSALSYSTDGSGVPGVGGMCDILNAFLNEHGLWSGYIRKNPMHEHYKDVDKYQKGLEHVFSVTGADHVTQIISSAMYNAYNIEEDHWTLSKAMSDLSNLLKISNGKIKTILTTNFDEMIEQAVDQAGLTYHQYNLLKDQSIGVIKSNDDPDVIVAHMHGIWNSDTMHTSRQLSSLRDKIKESIIHILSNSKLYVIGYSGWDDIFIDSLESAVKSNENSYSVKWAYYNPLESVVQDENVKLFSRIQPAVSNNRFQGYLGVDCNKFIEDVIFEIKKKPRK